MWKLQKLQQIQKFLNYPNTDSLNLSMKDTHHAGLFSLVIHGTEFGKLIRVFIADEDIQPYEVQLHTHRYPIMITAIKGNITHYVAVRTDTIDVATVSLSEFNYKSPLNGGEGLSYLKETNVTLKDYNLPVGATLKMTPDEFHTVSCKKGAIWIVEENGFKSDSSRVLGVPFITEGLYNPPNSFQINDKYQMVKSEINKLILAYKSIKV